MEFMTNYLTCFIAMLEQVPNLTDPEVTLCFQNGLLYGRIKTHIIMNGPKSRAEMLRRA